MHHQEQPFTHHSRFLCEREESTIILGLQSPEVFSLISFAKDVKTVDYIVHTQLAPGDTDMQLRHKTDPTKAFKAMPTTENAICSGRSKLNHENMEHVQSQGAARRNYKSVEAVSQQAQHGYCYDKLEKKWQKYLPLGESGDAMPELMDIFPDLFKGIGMYQGSAKLSIRRMPNQCIYLQGMCLKPYMSH